MGGLREAAVKSFQNHFKKVASDFNFIFEEFSTLLTQIEAVLNSEPISLQSELSTGLSPLTPAHFLRGGPLIFSLAAGKTNICLYFIKYINGWYGFPATKLKIIIFLRLKLILRIKHIVFGPENGKSISNYG